ncbi:MAG: DUF4214 domain-containing protein [Acidimicrobiales bacterium]
MKSTATNTAFSTAATPSVVLTFTISTPATTTTTSSTSSTPRHHDLVDHHVDHGGMQPDKELPFLTVSAGVSRQYLDFTGAYPTTAQVNQWVPPITLCTQTLDDLTASLVATDLTLDDARLLRLYVAYFNRPPDPDGFAYWQRQLDNGKGLINAAKKFAESSEFKRVYGTLDNGQFIDLVYQNVLGRAPDASGRQFWLTRLDNGTKNRGDVMINFSESSENVRTKTNHVLAFRLFRGMRQKFPSKAEFWAIVTPMESSGKTLAAEAKAIRLSSEYAARF